MKISIIIPAYNEEKYIENALRSLVNQTEKPDEVIVVDNNCTDKTIKIAKKYQKKLPLKIIREKKQGIAYSRNTGFNKAKGEIVVKFDADSIIPPQWIKETKKTFEKNKKIAAYSNHFYFYDSPILKKSLLPSILYQFFFKTLSGYGVLLGPAFAIKKSIWEKIKNEVCVDDDKVHEDIDITIHIAKYGKIFIDKNTIIYTSSRRIKYNPLSFFIEYPLIFLRMLLSHRKK
ncbi:MAG: glycosyltransferase family 2 protein [Patescibacteria group bacterium]|nr:glycosyltransferase family 2 protein [Patescibacteria group bacterium]